MVSDLNQKLYLGALPAGLKFRITEVQPSIPEWQKNASSFPANNWAAVYDDPNGRAWAAYADKNKTECISELIDVEYSPGSVSSIGRTKFVPGDGIRAVGNTGYIKIRFEIEGKVTHEGGEIQVSQTGFISITASEWLGFQRPDHSIISYNWASSAAETATLGVPSTIAGMPDDVHFIIALDPTTKQLGMSLTTSKDFALQFTDTVIGGVFKLHEKMWDWVKGQIA